jgi:adenylate cyclase
MGEDEEATLRTLSGYRKIIDQLIENHRGRFVNSAGDSVLAEFTSVVEAVNCAVDIQDSLKAENQNLPPGRQMEFRIGVNSGDVMVEGEQIYGDGVNVAARLESLADPGGICISGVVHDQIRDKLALGYEDLGEQEVKNIARPVRVYRVSKIGNATPRIEHRYLRRGVFWIAGGAIIIGTVLLAQHFSLRPPHTHASIQPVEKPAVPLPNKPSIVVLPFANLSGDAKQDYFSDGITDDLITGLSRLPGLFVIDRNSTFSYKNKLPKVQDVSRELGVKYVLEGSARKESDQIRINVQLVDADTRSQVWAKRYDEQFRQVFKVQDDIVESLIATLNVQLPLLQEGYVVPQRTNNLEAYDSFLRGIEYFLQLTPDAFTKGRKMFERAINLDSDYADSYTALSLSYFEGYVFQWDNDPTVIEHASELAKKAISLDDSDPTPYAILGWIDSFKGDRDQAIANAQRALARRSQLRHGLPHAGR